MEKRYEARYLAASHVRSPVVPEEEKREGDSRMVISWGGGHDWGARDREGEADGDGVRGEGAV